LSRGRSSLILAPRIFLRECGDHVGQRSARPIVLKRAAGEGAAVGPGLEVHGAGRLLLKSPKVRPWWASSEREGVEDGRVWIMCECGAGLCRWLAPPLCYTPPSL
jgi:hypothetical protein